MSGKPVLEVSYDPNAPFTKAWTATILVPHTSAHGPDRETAIERVLGMAAGSNMPASVGDYEVVSA